jgi:hypothetical protein
MNMNFLRGVGSGKNHGDWEYVLYPLSELEEVKRDSV